MLNFLRGNFLTIIAGVLLFGPFLFGYHLLGVIIQVPLRIFSSPAPDPYFHILLPATDKDPNLCKLLLSSRALGYPDPVFVGWEQRGQYNGAESHLFKISETLAYLRALPAEADNDIILLLDAYDIWLQLRPDVLIKRYNDLLERENERLKQERIHGKLWAGADVRQSIVFGADKMCAPQRPDEPACWAVPNSTLPRYAFGPGTDSGQFELQRPRWLNSGTIMGPATAMRDMFSATVDMLSARDSANWDGQPSDQYYFAEVFAEQEINRHKLRDPAWEADHPEVEKIPESKRTEFHMTVDYESELFQVVAGYENHLTWMRFNDTTPGSRQHGDGRMQRLDELPLAADVKQSDPPFTGSNGKDGLPFRESWPTIPLGINAITGRPFPVMHMTSSKGLRNTWWHKMWYVGSKEYSDKLADAAIGRVKSKNEHIFASINTIKYRPSALRLHEYNDERLGGAWTPQREFIPFQDVCEDFDDALYIEENKGWYDVGFPSESLNWPAPPEDDDKKEDEEEKEEEKEEEEEEKEEEAVFEEAAPFADGEDGFPEEENLSEFFEEMGGEIPAR